jgi:SAM-dependent methyltransferase
VTAHADADTLRLKHEERRWQDRHGGDLQERTFGRPGTRAVLHEQFASVAEALRLRSGLRVLDLGCGVGHFLEWLSGRRPGHYYGLDLSVTSVGRARQRNPALRLIVGDGESLPYRDGSFDRVTCLGTAHHFFDADSALREIHRILAPGGILCLYEPAATILTTALRHLVLRHHAAESPADHACKHDFTVSRIRSLLLAAGFAETTVSFRDFLAYPLSGNYLGSPWSRSPRFMERLCRLERALTRSRLLKPLRDALAWRVLAVAIKGPAHP